LKARADEGLGAPSKKERIGGKKKAVSAVGKRLLVILGNGSSRCKRGVLLRGGCGGRGRRYRSKRGEG